MMMLLLLLTTLCAGQQGSSEPRQRPRALLALAEARGALKCGEVTWVRENSRLPGRVMQYSARYASNGDRILEALGDQDGWVMYLGDDINRPFSKFPLRYLSNEEGTWRYPVSTISCDFWKRRGEGEEVIGNPVPRPTEFMDIRSIGVFPWSERSFTEGLDSVWCARPPDQEVDAEAAMGVVWSEQKTDTGFQVTSAYADGSSIVWQINSEKGWNAERVQFRRRDGTVAREAVSQLAMHGKHWFPVQVDFYALGEPIETFQISGAKFNRPSDATKFDGTSIGLEPGMNIHPQEVRSDEPHGGIKLWDGKRGLSVDAFREARLAGKVDYGPTVKARQANPHNPTTPYMTDEQRAVWMRRMGERERTENRSVPLSEWERYVNEFIAKYRLDQTHTQKAMQILKDCQERAEKYLASKNSEIAKIEQEQKKASSSGDRNARENARKQLDKLREPVDGVFEKELKPRLDKLPTREQRSAAGDTKE